MMTKASLLTTSQAILLLVLLPSSLSFSYNRYPTGAPLDNPTYVDPQQQQLPQSIPTTGVPQTQKDLLKQYLLNTALYVTSPSAGDDAEDQQEQVQEVVGDLFETYEEQMEQVQETLEQVLETTNERIGQLEEMLENTTPIAPSEAAEDPAGDQIQETLEEAQEIVEDQVEQVIEIFKNLTQITEEQAEQVEEVLDDVQEAAEEQAEQVQETLEDAQETAEEQVDQVQEILEDVLQSTEDDDDDATTAPEPESEDTDDVTTTTEPESEDTDVTDSVTTSPEPESEDADNVITTTEPESEDMDDVSTASEPESEDTDDVTTTEPESEDTDDVMTTTEPESEDTDDVITTPVPASEEVDEESFSAGLCDDCEFRHGVGYNPHPSDCTLFIQCRLGSNGYPVVAGVHSCPHGQYWNQHKLTCDFRRNVKCLDDVCSGYRKTKISRASCRGYWDCSSGTNIAKCCPNGTVYDPSTDLCLDQPDCQDDCLSSTTNASLECGNGFRAVPGDRTVYEARGPGNTWTRMPCPAGTAFTTNPCGCNTRLNQQQQQQTCVPELYLPFDKDHKDPTGRVWVKNEGVKVVDGEAYFNGSGSRLTINRFSYAWWGSTVYVNIRYKTPTVGPGFGTRQALVSNGDCQVRPSLAMCAGPNGVDFYAETQGNVRPVNFTVPYDLYAQNYQGSLWKDVWFNLEYNHLQGYVNYQMNEAVAKGPLESRQRGLVIGSGGGCEDFHGHIDKVAIYLCRPY